MKRFQGKVALVTGGTKGIGYAIAERLAREGASVVICSRRAANVEEAVRELKRAGRVDGFVCHVGTEEARAELVRKTVELHGRIDVLVSNVAVNPAFGPMLETTQRAWDKIMDVNVGSHFFLAKEAVRHMPRGGSVVFVSSVGGYVPFPDLGAYSVSKTALLGLTKALVPEMAKRGLRVNCLAPGVIKTRFSEKLWKGDDAAAADQLPPVGRFGTPEDCAAAVAYMAADEAGFMTGETVLVTGGIQARL